MSMQLPVKPMLRAIFAYNWNSRRSDDVLLKQHWHFCPTVQNMNYLTDCSLALHKRNPCFDNVMHYITHVDMHFTRTWHFNINAFENTWHVLSISIIRNCVFVVILPSLHTRATPWRFVFLSQATLPDTNHIHYLLPGSAALGVSLFNICSLLLSIPSSILNPISGRSEAIDEAFWGLLFSIIAGECVGNMCSVANDKLSWISWDNIKGH